MKYLIVPVFVVSAFIAGTGFGAYEQKASGADRLGFIGCEADADGHYSLFWRDIMFDLKRVKGGFPAIIPTPDPCE